MSRTMKVGPFTFSHEEFCNWHDTRYKLLREEGTPESHDFASKLATSPSSWFFDNSSDTTCNYTLLGVLVGLKPAPENDGRTKDKLSLKARMSKMRETDDVYTVIPASYVKGRSGLFQETGHLHLALYAGVIDGVIEVDEDTVNFIPLRFTVKVSRKIPNEAEFVEKINSHDNKADMVTNAQLNRMQMAARNLEQYSNHKLSDQGATIAKALTGSPIVVDMFSSSVSGPLFRAYLDNTSGNKNHFNTLQRALEHVLSTTEIPKLKPEHTQGGFTTGFLLRIQQYVIEEVLTVEEAVDLIARKMSNVHELSPREYSPLENSVRLIYNLQTVDVEFSTNHVANRHKQLGQAFAVACFINRNR